MSSPNPYAPPNARVSDTLESSDVDYAQLNRVASGQRIIIISLIVSFAVASIRSIDPRLGLMIGLITVVMSIVGALRIDSGLEGSMLSRVLYVITMLVPLINMVIMVTLSVRATKALRAAGYKVGLFGAKQRAFNLRPPGERVEPTL
jgi:hypothetical protein